MSLDEEDAFLQYHGQQRLNEVVDRVLYRLYSQVRYTEKAEGVSCNCVKRITLIRLPCLFCAFTVQCPSHERKQ